MARGFPDSRGVSVRLGVWEDAGRRWAGEGHDIFSGLRVALFFEMLRWLEVSRTYVYMFDHWLIYGLLVTNIDEWWLTMSKTIHICRIALIYLCLFWRDCMRFDEPLPVTAGCFLLAMLRMRDVAARGDFALEIQDFAPPSIPLVRWQYSICSGGHPHQGQSRI